MTVISTCGDKNEESVRDKNEESVGVPLNIKESLTWACLYIEI